MKMVLIWTFLILVFNQCRGFTIQQRKPMMWPYLFAVMPQGKFLKINCKSLGHEKLLFLRSGSGRTDRRIG